MAEGFTGWRFDRPTHQWVGYRLGEPFYWVAEEAWGEFQWNCEQVVAPDGWRIPVPQPPM